MKEATLQKRIESYIKSLGGMYYKNPPSKTGRLDIEYTVPELNGVWVIAEVKSDTRKLTVQQAIEISQLIDAGARVAVLRTFEDFLKTLEVV